jgi:hypothetical protein
MESLGRHNRKWEENHKTNRSKENEFAGLSWIQLADGLV